MLQITREEALRLVEVENQPRYPNLKWYLDVVGVEFKHAIEAVNRAPRLYESAPLPSFTPAGE